MLRGDQLDISLNSIQTVLDNAINLTSSHPTLDDACKTAIVNYLNQAKARTRDAQTQKSKCDQEYYKRILRESKKV